MTIVSHYGATALFLNSFWLWPDLQPPNAGLFWSLSFEATYYAGIAFFVFARGRVRVLGLVALAVAAGSTIVLLAATWILGFWAYHFSPRQRLRGRTALILWLGSTALLFSCFLIEEHFRQPLPFLRLPDHRLGAVMAAYAAAACFAFNLVAFDAISEGVETFLAPFTRVIRWLGSMTFALYLFHYPLLALLTAYGGAIPPSLRLPWLIGGTFVIVATLGHLCERSKDAYKKAFLSTWRRVNATPALVN